MNQVALHSTNGLGFGRPETTDRYGANGMDSVGRSVGWRPGRYRIDPSAVDDLLTVQLPPNATDVRECALVTGRRDPLAAGVKK